MKPLFWFKVIKGVFFSTLITLALLSLFAFLGLRAEDPAKHVVLYSNAALFLVCMLGGGMAARGAESPLLNSAVCGAMCAATVLIPSVILSDWGAESLLRLALTVLSSVIGGILLRDRGGRSNRRQSAKRRREIAKKYSV